MHISVGCTVGSIKKWHLHFGTARLQGIQGIKYFQVFSDKESNQVFSYRYRYGGRQQPKKPRTEAYSGD